MGQDGFDVDWLALIISRDITGGQPKPKPAGTLLQLNDVLCTNLSCVGDGVGRRLN